MEYLAEFARQGGSVLLVTPRRPRRRLRPADRENGKRKDSCRFLNALSSVEGTAAKAQAGIKCQKHRHPGAPGLLDAAEKQMGDDANI